MSISIFNCKAGDTLLKRWTKTQTWPRSGELLRKLMAEQYARQRMEQLPSMEAVVVYSLPWPLLVGGLIFPLEVHQPASPSICPAVHSHRRGLSTNPGVTMWCVCGCSWRDVCRCVWVLQRGLSGDGCVLASTLCKYTLRKGDIFTLSWARVRRVRLIMCGGGLRSILLLPLVARWAHINWWQSRTWGRERSNYLQWKPVLIVQANCSQVQPIVQRVKAGKTHFFKWCPISNKGDKEEILGDGTGIHHGSSEESNQEL